MNKTCAICGKKFHVKPSHFTKRTYCSRQCMSDGYKYRMKGTQNPNYRKAGEKKCQQCEIIFISYNKTSKFCSQDCAKWRPARQTIFAFPRWSRRCRTCEARPKKGNTYCALCTSKHKRIVKPCASCGKNVSRRPSEGDSKFFYCSRSCYTKNGENNPHWKGGIKPLASVIRSSPRNRELIAKTLENGGYKCAECGVVGGHLEADHIYKFSYIMGDFLNKYGRNFKNAQEILEAAYEYAPFWDETNFQVLCKKCNWSKELTARSIDDCVEIGL